MRFIRPRHVILTPIDSSDVYSRIAACGRVCYKSCKTTDNVGFVDKLMLNNHLSVIEHVNITVKFTIDRGVSHELVRHRLASYSQESTRYADYSGDIEFIIPSWLIGVADGQVFNHPANHTGDTTKALFIDSLLDAEAAYKKLMEYKWSRQEARAVLPNALATRIVVTANLREWKHILELRTSKQAHPQMMEVMLPLQAELMERLPFIFDRDRAPIRGRVNYGR